MRTIVITFLCFGFISLYGCMNGPSFLKQSNASNQSDQNDSVVVETQEENGTATGSISAESNLTQVVKASTNSEIAGSSVSFPPGAIAIDTEISIGAGEAIATVNTIDELGLDTSIASVAPSVTIASSVNIDASEPFTVELPLPDSAGLRLQDPSENVVVFYKVNKVVAGGFFTGIIPTDQIKIIKGFAQVTTTHFGTFQVAYLAKKVTGAVEVAVEEPTVEPQPDTPTPTPEVKKKTYFVTGFQSLSFGENNESKGGLKGWIPTVNPSVVGVGSTLTKDLIGRVYKGE